MNPVTPPDDPFFLRILPLGASITKGLTSEAYGGNGYRKPLRDALRFTGWPVNMVGTKHDGTMHDNNHEGTSGFLISEVNAAADLSIPFLPNIVLLNAGTNDCERNVDFDTAHERMKSLVEKLLSKIPGTTVILSTLVPHKWPDANARVTTLNQRYRDLVKSMNNEHLLLADMNTGWLTESDLTDKTHPTEEGYRKMAAVWERAIYAALSRNVVTRPATTSHDDVGGNSCLKEFGSGNTRGVVKTQAGSGLDDGPYIHSSSSRGTFNQLAYGSDTEDSHTHRWFAQLVNVHGGYREMAIDESVRQVVGSDGSLRFFDMILNQGNGDFIGGGIIDVKNDCKAKGVNWGDVNGDGLDDFICIGAEGNMYVSINDGGTSPLFTYIGLVFSVPKGYSQGNVRLGDIDGDGRIDYCVVGANGDIRCWRNGGIGGNPEYWQEMGPDGQIVFTGKGVSHPLPI
ncbi:hypothetical protein SLS60_002522 [Paraconiothyrium brasiliense]|uniref:SGNH hydrolase-type esterase domain-containing protein n=1 Tax=Paraconiothyrium brasiliense TaxID=300254 RepID=A0ABR3S2E3_9PLEO